MVSAAAAATAVIPVWVPCADGLCCRIGMVCSRIHAIIAVQHHTLLHSNGNRNSIAGCQKLEDCSMWLMGSRNIQFMTKNCFLVDASSRAIGP
jgi:hypothetical protein